MFKITAFLDERLCRGAYNMAQRITYDDKQNNFL